MSPARPGGILSEQSEAVLAGGRGRGEEGRQGPLPFAPSLQEGRMILEDAGSRKARVTYACGHSGLRRTEVPESFRGRGACG